MSGRKKLFCAVFLALCLICRMPLAVFAEPAGDPPVPTSSAEGTETAPSSASEDPDAAAKKAAEEAAAKKAAEEAAAKKAAEEAAAKKAAEEAAAKKASSAPPSSPEPAHETVQNVTPETDSEPDDASSFLTSSLVSSLPAAPSSSEILLPGVDSVSETDPLASAAENRTSSGQMNLYGILAWACIGLGIAVVLIVVLSNRRPPRGPGRSRYHRPKRGGKHLLDAKYYRDINRY